MTGDPGCGKTTALRRVVEQLGPAVRMSGFFTEELREGGRRVGFRGVTLDGRTFPLAHVEGPAAFRVGAYGVDVSGLETVGLGSLAPTGAVDLVVLDEVGKMECFSQAFREAVTALLGARVAVLGTVAVHGLGFVKRVRQDPRVTLLRMTRTNRDAMPVEILRRLGRAGIGVGAVRGSRDRRAATRRP